MERKLICKNWVSQLAFKTMSFSSWKFIFSSIARQDDKNFPWTTEYFFIQLIKENWNENMQCEQGRTSLYPILIKLSRNRNLNNKIHFARVVKNRKKCANSIFIAVLVLNSLSHIHCDYQHSVSAIFNWLTSSQTTFMHLLI